MDNPELVYGSRQELPGHYSVQAPDVALTLETTTN